MEPYKPNQIIDITVKVDRSFVKGKTAIVTGGANGIGKAYVHALVNAGAYVYFGDLDETSGQALVTELGSDRATFVRCNVTLWEDQMNLFKKALHASPSNRIDYVVANAGVSGLDSVFAFEDKEEPDEPSFRILKVNMLGATYTVKLALHYFRRQHNANPEPVQDTCLVFQGSTGGYMEGQAVPEYCGSKFALRGMMRVLRRTTHLHGTRVGYIAPSFIRTNIMSEAVAQTIDNAGIPFATVEDAAAALMRIICDTQVSGRTLTVVPKDVSPCGFVDYNLDDFPVGSILHEHQEKGLSVAHRLKEALAATSSIVV